MSRLPEIDVKAMTEAQKKMYDSIASGPRGSVRGPFMALLHAPEAGNLVQAMGAYLRFGGALPGDLRELAILVTARKIRAQYEFFAHAPIGEKEGLDPKVVEAVRNGKEPANPSPDVSLVYRFAKQLNETYHVDDATYRAAVERFGESGTVELVVLCGYYTMIGMTLNVFDIQPPEGKAPFTD